MIETTDMIFADFSFNTVISQSLAQTFHQLFHISRIIRDNAEQLLNEIKLKENIQHFL